MCDLARFAGRFVVDGNRLLIDGGHITASGDEMQADLPAGSRAARLLRQHPAVRVDFVAKSRVRLSFPVSAFEDLISLLRPKPVGPAPLRRRFLEAMR